MATNNINNSNYFSVTSYTNKGMSGLVSGLDTESMVKKMLAATQKKIDTQLAARQRTLWKQMFYRDIISSINTVRNKYFNPAFDASPVTNLFSSKFYNTMVSNVTAGSAAKVISTAYGAPIGETKIVVEKLATAEKLASQITVGDKGYVAAEKAMTESMLAEFDKTLVFNIAGVATPLTIDLNGINTQQGMLDEINNALSSNGINATASVFDNKLRIIADSNTTVIQIAKGTSDLALEMTGLSWGSVSAPMEAQTGTMLQGGSIKPDAGVTITVNLDGVSKQITLNPDPKTTGGDMLTAIKESLNTELDRTFGDYVNVTITSDDRIQLDLNFVGGTEGHSLTVSGSGASKLGIVSGASSRLNTASKLGELEGLMGERFTFTIGGKEFTFTKDDTISSMMNKVNNGGAGVQMSFSSLSGKFTLTASSTGGAFDEISKIKQSEGNLLSVIFQYNNSGTATPMFNAAGSIASINLTTNSIEGTNPVSSLLINSGAQFRFNVDGVDYVYSLPTKEGGYLGVQAIASLNDWLYKQFGTSDIGGKTVQNIEFVRDGALGSLEIRNGSSVSFAPPLVDITSTYALEQGKKSDLALALGLNVGVTSNVATGDTLVSDIYQVGEFGSAFGFIPGFNYATGTLNDLVDYVNGGGGLIAGGELGFSGGRLTLTSTSGSITLPNGLERLFGLSSTPPPGGVYYIGPTSPENPAYSIPLTMQKTVDPSSTELKDIIGWNEKYKAAFTDLLGPSVVDDTDTLNDLIAAVNPVLGTAGTLSFNPTTGQLDLIPNPSETIYLPRSVAELFGFTVNDLTGGVYEIKGSSGPRDSVLLTTNATATTPFADIHQWDTDFLNFLSGVSGYNPASPPTNMAELDALLNPPGGSVIPGGALNFNPANSELVLTIYDGQTVYLPQALGSLFGVGVGPGLDGSVLNAAGYYEIQNTTGADDYRYSGTLTTNATATTAFTDINEWDADFVTFLNGISGYNPIVHTNWTALDGLLNPPGGSVIPGGALSFTDGILTLTPATTGDTIYLPQVFGELFGFTPASLTGGYVEITAPANSSRLVTGDVVAADSDTLLREIHQWNPSFLGLFGAGVTIPDTDSFTLGDLKDFVNGEGAFTTPLLPGGRMEIVGDRIELTADNPGPGVYLPAALGGLFGLGSYGLDMPIVGDVDAGGLVSVLPGDYYSKGQDAEVTINGVSTTRANNTFEFDGLTIQLTKVSEITGYDSYGHPIYEETVINTERDTETIVAAFKSFVEDYNAMIEKLNGYVYADATYRDYAPLTDEQKREMTDREIELWEEQAKGGLLRSDPIVTAFLNDLYSTLYSRPLSSPYALYDLGIESPDYKNPGILTLDESKLREALALNPGAVEALFTDPVNGIATRMNTIMDNAARVSIVNPGNLVSMAGVQGSVTDTNSFMYSEIERINERLQTLQARYEKERDRYWKQFNAMEAIINNYMAQSQYISQMFMDMSTGSSGSTY